MKIQIQTEMIGPHVVNEIDILAVTALDGIVRAMAVVELLDTNSLAWLRQRLFDVEEGTTGLRGVLSEMRDLVAVELADIADRPVCP